MDAKYDADSKIADSARQYQMQKANFDMEVNARVRTALLYGLVTSSRCTRGIYCHNPFTVGVWRLVQRTSGSFSKDHCDFTNDFHNYDYL